MPWKELFTMEIREEFVLRATSPNANVVALCRDFGVSRKTGYEWFERFEDFGVVGGTAAQDLTRIAPLDLTHRVG